MGFADIGTLRVSVNHTCLQNRKRRMLIRISDSTAMVMNRSSRALCPRSDGVGVEERTGTPGPDGED